MSQLKLVKWKCHKVVEAGQIVEVKGTTLGLSVSKVRIDIEVDAAYIEKHAPEAGGYYVRYEDGYESYSPAEAFQAGYTMLLDGFSTKYPVWYLKQTEVAFKIGQLNYAPDGACVISPEDPALASVTLSRDWCEEYHPRVGGYLKQRESIGEGWAFEAAQYFEQRWQQLPN